MHHAHDDHYKIIARIDERRYISKCAHGTIHLVWGIATIRFLPQDMPHVAHLLGKGSIGDEAQRISHGPLCLTRNEGGGFVFVVKEFGLHLNAVDFLQLVDLVGTALQRMGYADSDDSGWPAPPPPAVAEGEFTRNSFSLN